MTYSAQNGFNYHYYSSSFMSILVNFFVNYPFAITPLLWIFIYLDMTLTRSAFEHYSRVYKSFIELESYELNPIFQETIHGKSSWPKNIVYRGLFAGFLLGLLSYLLSIVEETRFIIEIILGMFIALYLDLILSHLTSRRIFKYVTQNPSSLEGKIIVKNRLIYATSKISRSQFRMIWIIAWIFTPSYFILGAVVGESILIYLISRWGKKIELQRSRSIGWNQTFPELIDDENEVENNKKV